MIATAPVELPAVSRDVLHKIFLDEFDGNIDLWLFETFKQVQGHVSYEQVNTSRIACNKL